jgi:hypothetical protein
VAGEFAQVAAHGETERGASALGRPCGRSGSGHRGSAGRGSRDGHGSPLPGS